MAPNIYGDRLMLPLAVFVLPYAALPVGAITRGLARATGSRVTPDRAAR